MGKILCVCVNCLSSGCGSNLGFQWMHFDEQYIKNTNFKILKPYFKFAFYFLSSFLILFLFVAF